MTRWLVLASFLASSVPLAALAEDAKIGYVDLQRAIPETEDGRKAKANLKKVFDQKQKELDEQQEDLKKAIEDLEKKRTLLPADTVRQKEGDLQNRMQKVQQTYMRHQQDLQQRESEVMSKILERMQRIIARIATTENFTLIVEKSALVYAKPSLDLTNDLIRRYNAGEGVEGAPAPAPKGKKK
jgi:outer membrane protein